MIGSSRFQRGVSVRRPSRASDTSPNMGGHLYRLCSPLAKRDRCYDAVGMRIGSPEVLRIPDNRGLSLWTSSHNASHTEIESHFACNSLTEMAKSGAVWHYPTTEVFLNQKKPELPLAKPVSSVFHLP